MRSLPPWEGVTLWCPPWQDLLKHTPEDHPDHPFLIDAQRNIKQVAERINKGMKSAEEVERNARIVQEIESHIEGMEDVRMGVLAWGPGWGVGDVDTGCRAQGQEGTFGLAEPPKGAAPISKLHSAPNTCSRSFLSLKTQPFWGVDLCWATCFLIRVLPSPFLPPWVAGRFGKGTG